MHCFAAAKGLARRVGAKMLMASTSEVYGGAFVHLFVCCEYCEIIQRVKGLDVQIILGRTLENIKLGGVMTTMACDK